MNLIAIMPLRNEEWIAGLSVRAVLRWVDQVICLNHASTDATSDILHSIARETRRVVISEQPEQVWNEMDHRQHLLTMARNYGATHIAYVDADEVLTANVIPSIRQWCEELPHGVMLSLPWLQLRGDIRCVHVGGVWGTQCASVVFRDHPKAGWAARNGYHFHQREPLGIQWQHVEPIHKYRRTGGLMHLQMVSSRRLRAKQRLYVLTERVRWPERQMPNYAATVYGYPGDQLAEAPAEWWAGYEDLMQYLDVNAVPWQEQAAQDLIDQYGIDYFKGLDLFL